MEQLAGQFGLVDHRYSDWIAFVFDRPVTPDGWYCDRDNDDEFGAAPAEILSLVRTTMLRASQELAAFTDAQVYHGLNYIFSPIWSNCSYSFSNENVPVDQRVAAILAMKHLYTDCFEPRCCDARFAQLSEISNPLNEIAFMLWDITPISRLNRHLPETNAAVMEVLKLALLSRNQSCIESGLHGLGHCHLYAPELTTPIIDQFLAATCDTEATTLASCETSGFRPVQKALRDYARLARAGHIL